MTESGAQLFARLDGRRSVHDIEPRLFPPHAGPGPGAVVELYGTEGTGKTELLYHFLCRAVLPVDAGGLQLEVLFVDTDYSLDVLRLVGILDARLGGAGSSSRPRQPAEARVRECLSRLLVAHCNSSRQLLATLHALETRLASRPGLAFILLDSASAFYWPDRGEGGASVSKQEEKLSKCSQLLGALLRDYRISVFASCHSNQRRCSHTSSSSFSHLCRPWQRLVTHRMLCSRQEVAPAGGGPRAHVFSVHCTSSSSGSKAHKSCSFRVGDGGLEFV
ncbi:DNA repair protein XRCC2 isoform X4 [Syngnathus typhle]|uniref:DNA repair protein XRCC2 isoform X4 n=1 Tax=Syngnathus typhle TaxID=161592 RepID=UPI002A6A3D35|nr:DNA repair protein XRCC2 isoform X4 [Syngnathus typhle]